MPESAGIAVSLNTITWMAGGCRGSRMGYARRSLAEAMLSGGAVMLLAVAVYMLFVAAWCGTHGMVVTCHRDGRA